MNAQGDVSAMYQFGEHRTVSACAPITPARSLYPDRFRYRPTPRYIRFSVVGAGGREFESPHPDQAESRWADQASVVGALRLGDVARWFFRRVAALVNQRFTPGNRVMKPRAISTKPGPISPIRSAWAISARATR